MCITPLSIETIDALNTFVALTGTGRIEPELFYALAAESYILNAEKFGDLSPAAAFSAAQVAERILEDNGIGSGAKEWLGPLIQLNKKQLSDTARLATDDKAALDEKKALNTGAISRNMNPNSFEINMHLARFYLAGEHPKAGISILEQLLKELVGSDHLIGIHRIVELLSDYYTQKQTPDAAKELIKLNKLGIDNYQNLLRNTSYVGVPFELMGFVFQKNWLFLDFLLNDSNDAYALTNAILSSYKNQSNIQRVRENFSDKANNEALQLV